VLTCYARSIEVPDRSAVRVHLALRGGIPLITAPDETIEPAILRRVTLRLIPFLFILYITSYLDRVNVGFAALQMNEDLHFSSAAFGLGSGIFFLGYCLFEVPSNLILARVGARLWIARIMISWGLLASAMGTLIAWQSSYMNKIARASHPQERGSPHAPSYRPAPTRTDRMRTRFL